MIWIMNIKGGMVALHTEYKAIKAANGPQYKQLLLQGKASTKAGRFRVRTSPTRHKLPALASVSAVTQAVFTEPLFAIADQQLVAPAAIAIANHVELEPQLVVAISSIAPRGLPIHPQYKTS